MSKHAKIALGCFAALFALTRMQTFILRHNQVGNKALFLTAVILGCTGLLAGIAVFVCLAKRVQWSKEVGGRTMRWTQWGFLAAFSLAFMSEPIAMFIGIGMSIVHR